MKTKDVKTVNLLGLVDLQYLLMVFSQLDSLRHCTSQEMTIHEKTTYLKQGNSDSSGVSCPHPALGAIELLNLLSRPPKKPFTSVLDVVFRRRSAAPFFTVSQELALLRYESRPAGVAPRSSSSEGDGWDFPAQQQTKG